jgi:hypothetical protein
MGEVKQDQRDVMKSDPLGPTAEVREDDGDPAVASPQVVLPYVETNGWGDHVMFQVGDSSAYQDRADAIKDLIVGERLVRAHLSDSDGVFGRVELVAKTLYEAWKDAIDTDRSSYISWEKLGPDNRAGFVAVARKAIELVRMFWMSDATQRIAALLRTQDQQVYSTPTVETTVEENEWFNRWHDAEMVNHKLRDEAIQRERSVSTILHAMSDSIQEQAKQHRASNLELYRMLDAEMKRANLHQGAVDAVSRQTAKWYSRAQIWFTLWCVMTGLLGAVLFGWFMLAK